MNIASLLTSVKDPERPALVFPRAGKSMVTFRELDDLSSRLAAGMDSDGLRAGDRVVVLAPISLMIYASLIAIFKLGATAVFLEPQTGLSQLNRALELADARALIATQRILGLGTLIPALRRIPTKFLADGSRAHSLPRMAESCSPLQGIEDVEDEFPALITFTGGSTDESPRGVLRTHRLLIEQHNALSRILTVHENDVDLPAFPVATLHNLASGITSVLPDFPFRRPDAVQPERILQQMETQGITTASGSPAYWKVIVGYCLQLGRTLNLRRIVTGGAPTSPVLMQRLKQIAPQAEVLNIYGSTEAEPVASLSIEDLSDEMLWRIETGAGIPLGKPIADVRVRILDENRVEQTSGEVGEIWVSGAHVARRYFSNPKADATNKYLDGEGRLWHRMGDVGYRDAGRCLWLVGRVNTVIRRNGKPMYPVQVETVVATLPFVERAALAGDAQVSLREHVVLFVEASKEIPLPGDWRSNIESLLLGRGWVVDEIRLTRKIPVDARHNARIDYQRLQKMAAR